MEDLSNMNQTELRAILELTRAIADRAQFAQGGIVDPDKSYLEEARRQAEEYAKAVNTGARSRQYDLSDENVRDGRKSALDWLSRRRLRGGSSERGLN